MGIDPVGKAVAPRFWAAVITVPLLTAFFCSLAFAASWFEGVQAPVANYLLPILYSRAQLQKEGTKIQADWGVVGCLYTMEAEEIPMAPITMLRNALGVDEGGSGVALDRAAYARSVAFWNRHANWR